MEQAEWKKLNRKQLGDLADSSNIKIDKRKNLKTMQEEFFSKLRATAKVKTKEEGSIEVTVGVEDPQLEGEGTSDGFKGFEELQQVEDSYIEIQLSELKVKETFFTDGEKCTLEKTLGVKAYWYNTKQKKHYTGSNFRVVEVKQ